MKPTINPLKWKDGVVDGSESTQLLLSDGRILWARYDKDTDYNFYSKSHTRKYGPKITISNRRIVIWHEDGGQGDTVLKLAAWRGNWQLKAIIAAGFTADQYTAMIVAARLQRQ